MSKACPKCFTTKFREIRESTPVKIETSGGLKPVIIFKSLKCRRCGWEGQREELVSLRKLSVVKLGKIRSQMKRRR